MFDEDTKRINTYSCKWDMQQQICGRKNLIPFWIADMDFKSPPAVLQALQNRLEHGVFGYTYASDNLKIALINWFKKRHDWKIEADSLVEIPSIVSFLYIYTAYFTQTGESVIIQEPVYHPARNAIVDTGRKVVNNQLFQDSNKRWQINFEGLNESIKVSGAKNLIFCNPHNPVGRVWTKDEINNISDICQSNNVRIISDEIHADLSMPGYSYTPWFSIEKNNLTESISLISANKTFNLPGLNTAWAVIPDPDFRKQLQKILKFLHLESGSCNPFSYTAAEAAWLEGGPWLDQLVQYINENYQLLKSYLNENIPLAQVTDLEATFLVWIDLKNMGYSENDIWNRFLDRGIWLSHGSQFGVCGKGFWRMNIACPRWRLIEGLEKMQQALV